MNQLSKTSISRLNTCKPEFKLIIDKLSLKYKIQVIDGARTLETQKLYYAQGKSKTLNSKHLISESEPLSRAIDLAPLVDGKIEWKNRDLFIQFAKDLLEIAKDLNIKIRWGGDWNMNGDWKDESFLDLVHFELV